jgi:hypothetical protein
VEEFHEPDWPTANQTVSKPTATEPSHDLIPTPDTAEKEAMKQWKAENPGKTLKEQRHRLAIGLIENLPWLHPLPDRRQPVFGFGLIFPDDAAKGDTFVRTDSIPNAMYKFNGSEWIAIDKTQHDGYTYDDAYIQHLISKLQSGEYDPDFLNDAEAQEIERRLQPRSGPDIQ